jgi:hypothetical protein
MWAQVMVAQVMLAPVMVAQVMLAPEQVLELHAKANTVDTLEVF